MSDKVAIVTGSNKGIGFAVVKALCKRFDGIVYLTSRDKSRGEKAVEDLKKIGLAPRFHVLDVADRSSVQQFKEYIEQTHGGIDVLVNNAAVIDGIGENKQPLGKTIDINYRSVLIIQELLFPLLRRNARVINVSSDCGHISNLRNKHWISRLSDKNLKVEVINEFVQWFIDSVKNDTFNKEDFADNATVVEYRVSKIALAALTFIQQRELENRGVIVNVMHPGLVSTDMTSRVGFLTPDQAADTVVYLALDSPASLRGAYVWYDRRVLDWYDDKADYYFKYDTLLKTYN